MNTHKITFLVDFLRTINAGTENQLAILLRKLPDLGYTVKLISLQDSDFLKNEAALMFPEVHFMSLGAESDISRSIPSLIKLFKLLKTDKPDTIQTFFPTSNSIGVVLAKLAGAGKIFSSRRDMGFNLSKIDILKLKFANPFVTTIIANSYAVKKKAVDLEKVPPEKIEVVYNGLDFHSFKNNKKDYPGNERIVAIVANLNREVKRVDLFIRACAIVHKEYPDVKFKIIGDGHLRETLELLAIDLGIKTISFLGRRGDVPELLAHVSVGVISSDSEGLSNAIMEYMAAGLPVVATDVGGNPELVIDGKTGLIVPESDEKAMAEAILTIIQSSEKAHQMGAEGKKMINEVFSIQTMVENTDKIYRQTK